MTAARRLLLGAWLVLLSIAPSLAAQADEAPSAPSSLAESLSGDARRDYEAALLLYKSGDFAGAGRRFSSAYAASRDVRLLWNAAACEQGQRHYAKAIALLRRYLASDSPLITEEATHNARAFLDAALPLTARLLVSANQPESQVYVDDELLGGVPLAAEARVDFGTHRVTLRKPQFIEATQTVTVTSAADVTLRFELAPVLHEGRLVVRAGQGDSIVLDGRFRALSSFDGALPSGSHRLRVTAAGSRPFETHVLIEDERTRALDVTLERAPLSARIPSWVLVAGGAALLAGAGTAIYFAARPSDSSSAPLPSGSAGKVQLPLR